MDQLEHDDSSRLQYPVLNQFYLDRQSGNIDILNRVDRLIDNLSDSALATNLTAYNIKVQEAINLNNSISGTEYYVQNEKWINSMFFKLWVLPGGNDSITPEEIEQINTLAVQCPYLAGNGVYKARSLNTMFYPSKTYNDLNICNYNGVYKNGSGLFDEEERIIDSLKNVNNIAETGNKIKVYPNPAHDQITVSYKIGEQDNAELVLEDMWGRVLQRINLPSSAKVVNTRLNNLPSGVYVYKYNINNHTSETGKLVISK